MKHNWTLDMTLQHTWLTIEHELNIAMHLYLSLILNCIYNCQVIYKAHINGQWDECSKILNEYAERYPTFKQLLDRNLASDDRR